jgi:hypothetical protein
LCPAQSDIELVPKKQILGFQLPARLEQVADEPYQTSEKNRHPGKDATILSRKANPKAEYNLWKGQRWLESSAELIDLAVQVVTLFAWSHDDDQDRAMHPFRRKLPTHLVRIHPDNAKSKDWVILLEAGTIIGPSPERLRVARSTLERKIVRKYSALLNAEYFLVVEGYDPRIHAVYFCPQLYKYDSDKKLVPLQGEEIGRLIARALESGITERRPWYEPSEKLPDKPVISTPLQTEFDSLVVDMPSVNSVAKGA